MLLLQPRSTIGVCLRLAQLLLFIVSYRKENSADFTFVVLLKYSHCFTTTLIATVFM